jgi:hypothetical protein
VVVTSLAVEVRADAVFQADGFANINDRPLSVFHQVAAGFGRDGIYNALQVLREFHRADFITGCKKQYNTPGLHRMKP